MNTQRARTSLYSAAVWMLAGSSLLAYYVLGTSNTAIPGVEELVSYLSSVEGTYIYIAAFFAILIEGLYFVGSFFPGSTLVVLLALLSQYSGMTVFIGTVISIFIGWCLAGAINILATRLYVSRVSLPQESLNYEVRDRLWTTWFPAFRANYEVAQVVEGGSLMKVFLSSVRVKFFASVSIAVYALVIPFFVDLQDISNKEGYLSVLVVALISFIVGLLQLKKYFLPEITTIKPPDKVV
jgi:hypothetical protein